MDTDCPDITRSRVPPVGHSHGRIINKDVTIFMEWGSFLEVGCHHHTPNTPLYLWLCAASWRWASCHHLTPYTPLYSLLALCGFLEVGCQRISDTSLLREKMRWYCRLLDRTLISSLPVCMYARQSWAATTTTQHDLLTNSLIHKLNMQHTY